MIDLNNTRIQNLEKAIAEQYAINQKFAERIDGLTGVLVQVAKALAAIEAERTGQPDRFEEKLEAAKAAVQGEGPVSE